METCYALPALSHYREVALDKGHIETLVQLNFSTVFDRVSYRGFLYMLKSIGVGGLFLFIVSELINDGKQHVRLNGKVTASVGEDWECPS